MSLSRFALKSGFFWDVLFSVRTVTDLRGCDRLGLASVCEENLSRLKRLTYLNASLNNITAIENLDGCESLEKLDLTGNFVDVESMEKSMGNLSKNERLRSLFLVGNPCMEEFERMREYVISRLPRLVFLDGREITEEERRACERNKDELARALEEKIEEKKKKEGMTSFWNAEMRYKAFKEEEKKKCELDRERETRTRKIQSKRMFERPKRLLREGFDPIPENIDAILQVNEGKYEFTLGGEDQDNDADENTIILRVQIPKHFDTSLVDVDCHSEIIRVLIKGELLLLRLPEKVREQTCKASRSKTTGELKVCMEKKTRQKKQTTQVFKRSEIDAALGSMTISATPDKAPFNCSDDNGDDTVVPPILA